MSDDDIMSDDEIKAKAAQETMTIELTLTVLEWGMIYAALMMAYRHHPTRAHELHTIAMTIEDAMNLAARIPVQ